MKKFTQIVAMFKDIMTLYFFSILDIESKIKEKSAMSTVVEEGIKRPEKFKNDHGLTKEQVERALNHAIQDRLCTCVGSGLFAASVDNPPRHKPYLKEK
jgi:CII-binding regulator of phage lambda lysogenization HflD